jgi:Ni/Co efflux regulator RcnB
MKSRSLIATAVALTLGMSSLPSFAQGNGRDQKILQQQHQRQDDRADRREDRRDDRFDRRDDRRDYRQDRRDDRRDRREYRYESRHDHRHYYYNARGPEFRRGAYIPREYRNRQYVVVNYRTHHLAAPPRGHQWVQVGGDYVLVAIATGIIASIILSH